MRSTGSPLPVGFRVRLHNDVDVGAALVDGTRVIRISPRARRMLRGRSLEVTSRATAVLADRLLDLDLADPDVTNVSGIGAVTVVVPVRDNPLGVARLLARLSPHLRCIVVDDASHDPLALRRIVQDHDAMLVRLDANVGPGAARDVGLRRVTTPLVAFVDSDVEVGPDAIAQLAAHFVDLNLAAVAPRIRSNGGLRWFERYDDACGALDMGARSATVRQWSPVAYVPSACLVARVDALHDGFDPSLRSGEDVDLVWRLIAAGYRVRYAAEIDAAHDNRRTVSSWLARAAFYGTSAAPLARRHGNAVAPAVMTPVAATAVAGILLQRRWSVAVTALCSAWMFGDVGRRLPELSTRQRLDVVRSTGRGLMRQASGLTLRHWWPVTAGVLARSSRVRRAVVVMAVGDALVTRRSSGSDLDPFRFALARRLNDLAYGAGVWWGAIRACSVRCLLPARGPS